jgi:sugar phosphate isomerase/epimerase
MNILFKYKSGSRFLPVHNASAFILIIIIILSGLMSCSNLSDSNVSKFNGVQIGVITYSYRSMPDQSLSAILNYAIQSGIGSVELMGSTVEEYAGIPQVKDSDSISNWRTTVSMDKFSEVRRMFEDKGVKINIVKLGSSNWSDGEIDYAFNVCKTLGAIGITMEISEEAAKRMAPFAEKHDLFVIFHNHGQPGNPDFSFEKYLAYGSNLMLNLDVGHYYGATGKDVRLEIEKLHNRIATIHIKDKTGPDANEPNKNQSFGNGETGVNEILDLIREKKWPITCDIELEYQIPEGSDAVQEVKKCVDYCREALETIE